MNAADIDNLASIIITKLRPMVRQELQRIQKEQRDLNDVTIDIHEISKILGHSEDWCRRSENKTYPHYMVKGKIMALRNNLMEYARLNGFRHADA